jgi:negative regulator of sigma E activity
MKRAVMCACLLGVSPLLHASDAMQLLNNMSSAIHELDYQGDLVYSQGEGFSILRVQHSIDKGAEQEKVTHLNHDPSNTQQVASNKPEGFSIASFPQVTKEMEKIYSFDLGGLAQVAGRECKQVVARPKDRMRYLHRYCIDTKTNMLLNYSLVDSNHKTVEKMMFTRIEYDKQNFKDYLKNKVASVKKKFLPFNLIKHKENKTNWHFSELPNGFHIDSVLRKAEQNGGTPLEQIILTDKVTSISVFIEPKSEHCINKKSFGYSGAVNGLTVEKEEHSITVIGEVPRSTLQKVADSLRYLPQ